jgi:hypothetical protein
MKNIKTCAITVSVLNERLAHDELNDTWEPVLFYPKGLFAQAPSWAMELPEFLKFGTLTKDDNVIQLGPDGDTWTVAYCWTEKK